MINDKFTIQYTLLEIIKYSSIDKYVCIVCCAPIRPRKHCQHYSNTLQYVKIRLSCFMLHFTSLDDNILNKICTYNVVSQNN